MKANETSRQYALGGPKRLLILAAVGLLGLMTATITFTDWARVSPFRDVGAEEFAFEFLAGRNFVNHGFLSRGFLPDYSTDNLPHAQPVYYTHNPPLPAIMLGVLILLGCDDLPSMRFVLNVVFLAGLIPVGMFFWRLLTPWQALAVLTFLAFNRRGVLEWTDHPLYAFWFGLTFLALWSLTEERNPSRHWVGIAAVFLISLINYIQLVVCLTTLVMFWVLRIRAVTLKKLCLASAAGGLGVLAHLVQNILVLGWDVATRDIVYTLQNRRFGEPSRDALLAFNQENDLILWGVRDLLPASNRLSLIMPDLASGGHALLIALVGLAAMGFVWKMASARFSFRLALAFAVGSLGWHFIFPAHGQYYSFQPAFALALAVAPGLFIGELVPLFLKHYRNLRLLRPTVVAGLCLVVLGVLMHRRNLAMLFGTWPPPFWASYQPFDLLVIRALLVAAGVGMLLPTINAYAGRNASFAWRGIFSAGPLFGMVLSAGLIVLGFVLNAHTLAGLVELRQARPVWTTDQRFQIHVVQGFLIAGGVLTFLLRPPKSGALAAVVHAVHWRLKQCSPSTMGANEYVLLLWLSVVLSVALQLFVSVSDKLLTGSDELAGELEILEDFRGHSFWTNVTPGLVNYYTRSWVVGQAGPEAVRSMDVRQAYLVTISRRSPTREELSRPQYFFYSTHRVSGNVNCAPPCLQDLRRYLEAYFEVVARSPHGSMVVDLTKRQG